MAISREKYKDINHTLKGLRKQIIDSLDFCADSNFYFDDPRQMYYNILPLCKYKNDPPGVELIQPAILTVTNPTECSAPLLAPPSPNRHVRPYRAGPDPALTAFPSAPYRNRPTLMNPDLTFLNRLPCHA